MKLIHEKRNPYPRRLPVGTVLDERCRCGHFRTEHRDAGEFGRGGCSGCGCQQFNHKTFILRVGTPRNPRYIH